MNTGAVSLSRQSVHFNNPDATARFGLIALATDQTSERDLYRQLLLGHVAIHVTRVAFENPTTPENLRKMTPRLTDAARLLAPAGPLRAICYSCTAASIIIGNETVRTAIVEGAGNVPVVTPDWAALTAFSALGVKRIAVLTPYTIETSEPFAGYFSSRGLTITRCQCLGLEDDRDMARVSDQTILEAALDADSSDAEAIFVSCTGMPSLNVITEIERRTGKPVVTSNQASAWAMARLGGLDGHCPGDFGRLFSCPLPSSCLGDAA